MPSKGYTKRRQKWTEEEIVEKIREWAKIHGDPPASSDWNPSDCRRSARISLIRSHRWLARAARFDDGEWPWPRTVQLAFGSWNNAIKAAGFDPRGEKQPELPSISPVEAVIAIGQLNAKAKQTKDAEKLRKIFYGIAEKAIAGAEGVES